MAMVKLGDVAIEKRETWTGSTQGVPIIGLEHLVPGEITLSSWDSDTDNTFSKMFRKDQVLLGRRRVYLKKAVIAPFDGICSGDITVIEAIPGKISPRLLPFIIQNERFFDYAIQGSAGSLSPRVKWEHLKDYEFNLSDYEEQESLANKLWSALKLKESYHALLLATDEMVKSRFIEQFAKYGRSHKLGDVVELMDDKRRPINDAERQSMKTGKLYPYYGATGQVDMINSYLTDDTLLCIAEDCGNYKEGEESSYIITGKAWVNNHAHLVKPNDSCNITFLHYYLTICDLTPYVTGTTRQKLTQKSLVCIPVILPPIDEQRSFVSVVQQADKSKYLN